MFPYLFEATGNMAIWSKGDVAGAILKAKQQKALIIVCIYGEDEQSEVLLKLMEDEKIVDLVNEKSVIALKLNLNSDAAKQFAALYPVNSVPAIFFVGHNGKLRDTVTSPFDNVDLFEKTSNALAGNAVSVANFETIESKHVETKKTNATGDIYGNNACSSKLITRRMKKEKREKDYILKDTVANENVEAEKSFEEKEKAVRNLREEVRRRRLEEKKLREKLLAQIKADRIEGQMCSNRNTATEIQSDPLSSSEKNSDLTRIQFRFPDGRRQFATFNRNDPLYALFDYVSPFFPDECQLKLIELYPRRHFTDVDYEKSLATLDLVPSAVMLIVTTTNSSSHAVSASGLLGQPLQFASTAVLQWLVNPVYNILSRMLSWILHPVSSATSAQPGNSTARHVNKLNIRQRRLGRLASNDTTDDENATWNGNSTQQL
ncbi:UBX domain-containing protein 4 [Trichinella pseudospiralis]|uniref:UBX domain-containing protein 4 n=1 Tax=Trichinella pseudospiralis TaxID=6337 RepID=A0A0V1G2D0_TRIPS|nr:UBX domain-containing protein 4 [Trichinella pseudospiralis]